MKGVILCEESGTVTEAFVKRGHEFVSVDVLPTSGTLPDRHFKMYANTFMYLNRNSQIDFIGSHPPCTYLANSGVRWLASVEPKQGFTYDNHYQIYINWERWNDMVKGADFFKSCLAAVERVGKGYVENPIIHKYALEIIGRKSDQVIQPWQFGHGETKATCLWLVNLPKLHATDVVQERQPRIHRLPPTSDPEVRRMLRSKTYSGIAHAMASQWG